MKGLFGSAGLMNDSARNLPMRLLGGSMNSRLDKLAHPEIRILQRPRFAFRVCGYTGLALAVLLAMILVTRVGLSAWVMAGVVLAAVSAFFGLAMFTKLLTGQERLIYYHHEIAVLVVAGALLWLLHQPILPYLDVTILGVGVFLICGRLGCLMAGCCHGVPHRWGVRYGAEHAGFTPYYVGVRLFPIQAVESVWVLGLVVVGSVLVLDGRPGTALVWYVVAYGLGRFGFEFVRGDPERPYLWGFSEAQWTSVLLALVVVWAETSGLLPLQTWHLGAVAGLVAVVIAVAATRRLRRTSQHQLLHPRHVREVAEAVESLSNPVSSGVGIRSTSLGIQISARRTTTTTSGSLYHYAFSWRDRSLLKEDARRLVSLVLQLKHPSGANEFVEGNRGVFHLLVHIPAGTESELHVSSEVPRWTTFCQESTRQSVEKDAQA
jgi:Prolipoprotein diacylglyceryl transferase